MRLFKFKASIINNFGKDFSLNDYLLKKLSEKYLGKYIVVLDAENDENIYFIWVEFLLSFSSKEELNAFRKDLRQIVPDIFLTSPTELRSLNFVEQTIS